MTNEKANNEDSFAPSHNFESYRVGDENPSTMEFQAPSKKYRDFEDDNGFEDDPGLADNHGFDDENGFADENGFEKEEDTLAIVREKALQLYTQVSDKALQMYAQVSPADKKMAILGIVAFSFFLNFAMMIKLSVRKPAPEALGWVRPNKMFGLVRMHMSGDTEINRMLALKYERVCGNSAYSMDAVHTNFKSQEYRHAQNDAVAQLYGDGNDRGRVPDEWMLDIGFEDCDYIAWQTNYQEWESFGSEELPMELHVPCPDALSHLMAQCQHEGLSFDCGTDVATEVEKCLHESIDRRFKEDLMLHSYTSMKCFDPSSPKLYSNYMDTILQPRRTQVQYTHHGIKPRDETKECIWKQPEVYKQEVLRSMRERTDYYTFCNKCMGSYDELPLL